MTKRPVIVTRAEPGAGETAARLRAIGLTPVLTPMLSLRVAEARPLEDAAKLSGLVFTSANGVRVYADRTSERALPAWCVGPATAEAAHAAGFSDVHESAGNAVDLAKFIGANSSPSDKPLLHVANSAAAGTLKSTLEALGFNVAFAPLYEMQPAEATPPSLAKLLAETKPAIVLIHSAKGAAAFAKLLEAQNVGHWSGVSISEPAGLPLAELGLGSVHVAETPNEDGLFDALQRAIATLSA